MTGARLKIAVLGAADPYIEPARPLPRREARGYIGPYIAQLHTTGPGLRPV